MSDHEVAEVASEALRGPWLTKENAAARLNVSVRQIENYIVARRLAIRREERSGRRPLVLVNPADVERIRAEQNNGAIVPAVHQDSSLVPAIREIAADVAGRLAPPARQKPFLGLAAAAEYSGLPARLLRRLVRQQRLASESFSGELFFRVADLDAVTFRVREVSEVLREGVRELRKGAN